MLARGFLMGRQLLLMRHAKSDWDADYDRDHDRPLNERGVRSAKLMGRLLEATGRAPHFVISSTAVRARTTAELAAEAGSWDSGLRFERGLYEEGPQGVIALASTAPDVDRLMLVGHQPTWSGLVAALTGERVDMKTASVAVVSMRIGRWSELPGATGNLETVEYPRDHYGGRWDQS